MCIRRYYIYTFTAGNRRALEFILLMMRDNNVCAFVTRMFSAKFNYESMLTLRGWKILRLRTNLYVRKFFWTIWRVNL